MTDEHTYYLGVDGGASKTTALVSDENGSPLGDGLAGPSNHLRVGIETASRNVERAVNKALVAADVTSREIVWAYCGSPGADLPAHQQGGVDSHSHLFAPRNFTLDKDPRIALILRHRRRRWRGRWPGGWTGWRGVSGAGIRGGRRAPPPGCSSQCGA